MSAMMVAPVRPTATIGWLNVEEKSLWRFSEHQMVAVGVMHWVPLLLHQLKFYRSEIERRYPRRPVRGSICGGNHHICRSSTAAGGI